MLEDPKRGSNMSSSVAAARRMFESAAAAAAPAAVPKGQVMDEGMRRASSMKLAFTKLREDLAESATTSPSDAVHSDDGVADEEIIELEGESDDYNGDDFELSADDEDLIAMLSGSGSKPTSAVSDGPTSTPATNSAGSSWKPPGAGRTNGADDGNGRGSGFVSDDDLVEELLEESLSQEFVDFDSVRVEDS